MPNCTWRPGFDALITPNVEPWKKLGRPRIAVLVTLTNCVINCRLVRSPSTNCLAMLRSAVDSPGPRKEPMAQLPKCPAVPGVADAGFQNCSPDCPPPSGTMAPLPDCETPAGQLARGDAEPVPELSDPSGVIAKPVCMVKSDAMLQPPMMAFTTSFALPPNILP